MVQCSLRDQLVAYFIADLSPECIIVAEQTLTIHVVLRISLILLV